MAAFSPDKTDGDFISTDPVANVCVISLRDGGD
jgi:hypothetical protein